MSKIKNLVSRVVLGAAIVDLPLVALRTVIGINIGKWETRIAKVIVKKGVVGAVFGSIDYDKPRKKQGKLIYERIGYGKQIYEAREIIKSQTKSQNYNHFSNYHSFS